MAPFYEEMTAIPAAPRDGLRMCALDEANAELLRRDMQVFYKEVAEMAARETAAAEELEQHRKSAWLNHRIDVALAKGNEAFRQLLSQKDMLAGIPNGWPPGDGPENYRVVGLPETIDDISGTLLGQALARVRVKI